MKTENKINATQIAPEAKQNNTPKNKNKNNGNKKPFFQKLNEKYFFESYRRQNAAIGRKLSIKQYISYFLKYFIITFVALFLIFPSVWYALGAALLCTFFMLNEISMNVKIMSYEYFLLCELCNYTQNMSLLLKTKNVYNSLVACCDFIQDPIKTDLKKVIEKIDNNTPVKEAFQEFNEKYNYRTVTLFNQTLDLIDYQGNSKADSMLYLISKELSDIRVKKDRYLRFKKEWRAQYYIVLLLCMVLPVMLKYMIPDIYVGYMNSFGNYIMFGVIFVNMWVIKKIEGIYRNQDIGDGGGR